MGVRALFFAIQTSFQMRVRAKVRASQFPGFVPPTCIVDHVFRCLRHTNQAEGPECVGVCNCT